jgi:hypothetical protein
MITTTGTALPVSFVACSAAIMVTGTITAINTIMTIMAISTRHKAVTITGITLIPIHIPIHMMIMVTAILIPTRMMIMVTTTRIPTRTAAMTMITAMATITPILTPTRHGNSSPTKRFTAITSCSAWR